MKGSELFAVASDHRARPIPHGPEPGSAYAVDRQPDDPGAPSDFDDGRALFRSIILTFCLEGALAIIGLAIITVLA